MFQAVGSHQPTDRPNHKQTVNNREPPKRDRARSPEGPHSKTVGAQYAGYARRPALYARRAVK